MARPVLNDVVVHETVDVRPTITCNLGCVHNTVPVLRAYVLAIVETRPVPDLWSRGYGRADAVATGLRAVDQFGDEWTSDWDSSNRDGSGSRTWVAADGRRAEQASAAGCPARGYGGWIDIDGRLA